MNFDLENYIKVHEANTNKTYDMKDIDKTISHYKETYQGSEFKTDLEYNGKKYTNINPYSDEFHEIVEAERQKRLNKLKGTCPKS